MKLRTAQADYCLLSGAAEQTGPLICRSVKGRRGRLGFSETRPERGSETGPRNISKKNTRRLTEYVSRIWKPSGLENREISRSRINESL